MTLYFRAAIQEMKRTPREGLIHSLLTAEVDGERLTEEEVIANSIVTMVGGQETTTNLIGNGMLTLLRHPESLCELRENPGMIPLHGPGAAMVRESESAYGPGWLPADVTLGGKQIKKRQAVIAVMAALNRDPERFPILTGWIWRGRTNRHLAFGWAAFFALLPSRSQMEGQIASATLLERLPELELAHGGPPRVAREFGAARVEGAAGGSIARCAGPRGKVPELLSTNTCHNSALMRLVPRLHSPGYGSQRNLYFPS